MSLKTGYLDLFTNDTEDKDLVFISDAWYSGFLLLIQV